jgi:DNA-binding winged helix-turn-helix (wHTH) protein
MLVERRSIPVSKDALMKAARAGLTVWESNLAVRIAALRRVLGEEAGGENWTEILPRGGLRRCGDGTLVQDAGRADEPPGPLPLKAALSG